MAQRRKGRTRRAFLGAAAGTGAAVLLGGPVAAHDGRDDGDHDRDRGRGKQKLIPADKVGTITFTQRDVPSRVGIAASAALGVPPTMGFLGGPDFPEDPTDLGPLVPLPGGWRELFGFLAAAGYKQIEFA